MLAVLSSLPQGFVYWQLWVSVLLPASPVAVKACLVTGLPFSLSASYLLQSDSWCYTLYCLPSSQREHHFSPWECSPYLQWTSSIIAPNFSFYIIEEKSCPSIQNLDTPSTHHWIWILCPPCHWHSPFQARATEIQDHQMDSGQCTNRNHYYYCYCHHHHHHFNPCVWEGVMGVYMPICVSVHVYRSQKTALRFRNPFHLA